MISSFQKNSKTRRLVLIAGTSLMLSACGGSGGEASAEAAAAAQAQAAAAAAPKFEDYPYRSVQQCAKAGMFSAAKCAEASRLSSEMLAKAAPDPLPAEKCAKSYGSACKAASGGAVPASMGFLIRRSSDGVTYAYAPLFHDLGKNQVNSGKLALDLGGEAAPFAIAADKFVKGTSVYEMNRRENAQLIRIQERAASAKAGPQPKASEPAAKDKADAPAE